MTAIRKEDIKDLRVGDKVTVRGINMFGGSYTGKGTVVRIEDGDLFVRKYRKRKMGWRIYEGKPGSIARGWL